MKIEISEQKSVLAIAVKKQTTMENFKPAIDEGYGILGAHIASVGKQMSSAPYVKYSVFSDEFNTENDEFEIEMGFPISEEIAVAGEIYMTKTLEGKIARCTYKGGYNELQKVYDEFFEYIKVNEIETKGVWYEFYLNDPSDTSEEELLTQVVAMLK